MGEGDLGPHLTQCGQGRGIYLHAKFHTNGRPKTAMDIEIICQGFVANLLVNLSVKEV